MCVRIYKILVCLRIINHHHTEPDPLLSDAPRVPHFIYVSVQRYTSPGHKSSRQKDTQGKQIKYIF